MTPALAELVRRVIDDLRQQEVATPAQLTLRHVVSRYRDRRDGFSGERYDDELRRYFSTDISPADVTYDDIAEIIGTLADAVADDPVGRAYVCVLVWRAEEPGLAAVARGLLARMWDDRPDDAVPLLQALGLSAEDREARDVLTRWASRQDEAGDAARASLRAAG